MGHFSDDGDDELNRQRWLRIAMIFCITNPALDPLIYAYSSREYRKGLMRILFCPRVRKVGRPAGVASSQVI